MPVSRCVPSVCTPEDVAQVYQLQAHLVKSSCVQGLRNVLEELLDEIPDLGSELLEPYFFFSLNCHTAEEEVKGFLETLGYNNFSDSLGHKGLGFHWSCYFFCCPCHPGHCGGRYPERARPGGRLL